MQRLGDFRSFFHFQYTGIVVPFLGALGCTLAIDGDFAAAYLSFAASGAWAACWWLSSDQILKQEELVRKSIRNKHPLVAARRETNLINSRIIGITISILIAGVGCWFVHSKSVQAALAATKGLLVPASDPTPVNPCPYDHTPEETTLLLGGLTAIFHTYPHTVLSAGGVPLLWLTKDHEGRVGVNADIRGPDMKLVARVRDNGFTLNQSSVLSEERPDFSTLKITDSFGEEALNVRYMNPSTISITGEFNYPGMGMFRLSSPNPHNHDNCSVDSRVADIYLGPPSTNVR